MKIVSLLFLLSICFFLGCSRNVQKNKTSVVQDSIIREVKTNKYSITDAKSEYSHKNQEKTQYDLFIESNRSISGYYVIKIYPSTIKVLNEGKATVAYDLIIKDKGINSSAPSEYYRLVDSNGDDYYLDLYSSPNDGTIITLRHHKKLEGYSNN